VQLNEDFMKHLFKLRSLGLSMILLTCFQVSVLAAGYQVYLPSSRAVAMGNLGVGLRPDASCIYVNPGGMSLMENNEVMVGMNPIFATVAFYNSEVPGSNYQVTSDNPMGTPFHVYAVWGPKESKWKFGLGAFTPFGSSARWGTEWQGRFLLSEISLQAIYTQLTASYAILDNLSVGAGFMAVFGSVELQRVLDVTSVMDPTLVDLSGSADIGYGFNLGLLWEISDKFLLGVNYRSKVDMKLTGGDVTYENVPAALASFLAPNKFDAQLPLPSSTSLALTFFPADRWTVGVEADYIGWSAYESLDFDFYDENIAIQDTQSPRNYQNSWVFHVGGEYAVNSWQFRAGAYYDLTPVQLGYMTPETPDANRTSLTAGIGYTAGNFQFDLSFLFISGQERQQTIEISQEVGTYPSASNSTYAVEPGTYKMYTYIPGLSVSYRF
jgi:long-chain fatty acid transport protein